jgi:hypothetical protein
MKKSLIAAAAFAALTFGAANMASAGVASVGFNGISTHAAKTAAEHVDYRNHHDKRVHRWDRHKKKRICRVHHGRRHCYWR